MEEKMDMLKKELHNVIKILNDFIKLLNLNWITILIIYKAKYTNSSKDKSFEQEMIQMKHRYLEIQEQLEMAEKVTYLSYFLFT
jgi:hypothetical protein